jgi:DNA invertase Pin-like site-specific DNA recombinase
MRTKAHPRRGEPLDGIFRIEEAEDGLGAAEIAKALKIGRASVYRVLEAG